jgi:hypothetical protein
VAQLRLKLAANKLCGQRVRRKKFDTEKFNHGEIRKKFGEELKKSLYQERMNELYSSEHWTVLKEAMFAKIESILGLRQRNHSKDWITEETWSEINVRKATKQKINSADNTRPTLLAEYSEINKRVERYARHDKLRYKAQLAAEINNSRELYQITKRLARKPFTCNQTGIRDEAGRLLATLQDQLTRWKNISRITLQHLSNK